MQSGSTFGRRETCAGYKVIHRPGEKNDRAMKMCSLEARPGSIYSPCSDSGPDCFGCSSVIREEKGSAHRRVAVNTSGSLEFGTRCCCLLNIQFKGSCWEKLRLQRLKRTRCLGPLNRAQTVSTGRSVSRTGPPTSCSCRLSRTRTLSVSYRKLFLLS